MSFLKREMTLRVTLPRLLIFCVALLTAFATTWITARSSAAEARVPVSGTERITKSFVAGFRISGQPVDGSIYPPEGDTRCFKKLENVYRTTAVEDGSLSDTLDFFDANGMELIAPIYPGQRVEWYASVQACPSILDR